MLRRALWLLLPSVALLIDWISKVMITHHLKLHETKEIIPGFFNLTLVHNPGAIFGVLGSAPEMLRTILFTLAVLGALAYFGYEFLRPDADLLQRISLGLILGGAMGNGLDRFQHGYVVDFLDFVLWGWHYWTFNIADSYIVCGAILMGINLIKSRQSQERANQAD